MRKFAIFEEPSPADPAHMIPVADITDANNVIQYTTPQELQAVVDKLNHTMSYNLGYTKGIQYVLESLGMTFPEFLNKKKS